MRKILGIARYTFIEIFRNKVYYVLLLFAVMLVGASLLLGALGGEQHGRMMIDFGLASIEAFSLLIAVFAAVTLVLEEMESRTLYLLLSRPVARYQFVLGRFLGLVVLLSATLAAMALSHWLLLWSQHIPTDTLYGLSLIYSWEKIVVITAIGMAFSLFATSTVSAVSFTFFFWVMGHFSSEIRYLAQKGANPVLNAVCGAFYYVAPNFQLLNLRDLASTAQPGTGWLVPAAAYGFCYTLVWLSLVVLLFRKKEF
jgi:ABC-type transport system involved in multi-copper enzyme maturation permease subunit